MGEAMRVVVKFGHEVIDDDESCYDQRAITVIIFQELGALSKQLLCRKKFNWITADIDLKGF